MLPTGFYGFLKLLIEARVEVFRMYMLKLKARMINVLKLDYT